MQDSDRQAVRRGGRTQLVLIALIFLLPLAAATWLYYGGSAFRPEGMTNHGHLLTPVINLNDEHGGTLLATAVQDRWALVYRLSGASCDTDCQDALYKQRQSRLMLGNDMSRLERVLLHGPEAPDTLFADQSNAGLIALVDRAGSELLASLRPRGAAPGGYFLIDPLGNVVLYFPPDIRPRDLVDDLEHLLELSRIG